MGPLLFYRIISFVPERRFLSRCEMPHKTLAPSRFRLNTPPSSPLRGACSIYIPDWIAIISFMRVLLPKERFLWNPPSSQNPPAFYWQTSPWGFTYQVIKRPVDNGRRSSLPEPIQVYKPLQQLLTLLISSQEPTLPLAVQIYVQLT